MTENSPRHIPEFHRIPRNPERRLLDEDRRLPGALSHRPVNGLGQGVLVASRAGHTFLRSLRKVSSVLCLLSDSRLIEVGL